MKKFVITLISLCLVVFFLIYSGVFRNDKAPVAVTEYFFQCMHEKQWVLTFQVTKFEFYKNGIPVWNLTKKWFLDKKINNTKFELLSIEGDFARVRGVITYEDGNIVENVTTLERNYHGDWVVSDTKFHPMRQ